jgi:hypothetical protein
LEGGRDQIGMVAAIKSVAWPRSNRNRWPRCIGIYSLAERAGTSATHVQQAPTQNPRRRLRSDSAPAIRVPAYRCRPRCLCRRKQKPLARWSRGSPAGGAKSHHKCPRGRGQPSRPTVHGEAKRGQEIMAERHANAAKGLNSSQCMLVTSFEAINLRWLSATEGD